MSLMLIASEVFLTLQFDSERDPNDKVFISSLKEKTFEDLALIDFREDSNFNLFLVLLKNIASYRCGPVGIKNLINVLFELIEIKNLLGHILVDLKFCLNSIIKEIDSATLVECLDLMEFLQRVDLSLYESAKKQVFIKFTVTVSRISLNAEVSSLHIEELVDLAQFIERSEGFEFNFYSKTESLISLCCNYLLLKYNLNDLGDEKVQIDEKSAVLINILANLIDKTSETSKKKLIKITDSIKNNQEHSPNTNNKNYRKVPLVDKTCIIKASQKNSYNLMIWKQTFPEDGVKFTVKEYSFITSRVRPLIENEIGIMFRINEIATDENCFMKLYDCVATYNSIKIYMEYHQHTLEDYILAWKDLNYYLPENTLLKMMRKLIEAFARLEEMGINHRDIKPENILVTDEYNFKIIDFNISLFRLNDNFQTTMVNSVEGTQSYMAPEVLEKFMNGEQEGRFRPGRADVFSLGLTFLKMANLESLIGLNERKNYKRLIEKVNQINYSDRVKEILKKMLQLDYHQRAKFKKLIKFVDDAEATDINL